MKEAATAKGRRTTERGESSSGSSSSSGVRYKGVRMRKWGKWVAEVRLPNSRDRIWLGSYDSPEKAARAYDAAVFCLRGPSASFNFPGNPPAIPSAGNLTPEEIGRAARKFANEGGPPAEQTPAPTSQEVPQMEATTGLLNYYPPSPFDEFPAGLVFTREGEDDQDEEEEAQDTDARLWSF